MKRYAIVEEIFTPLIASQAFRLFQSEPCSFFLDSGLDPQRLGRYSFIGSQPFLVLKSRGEEIYLQHNGERTWEKGNPFDVLAKLLEMYVLAPYPFPIPFCGGVVGYFSYDLCHFIEHLPSPAADDLNLPDCYLAFYDAILAFDELQRRTYVVSTGFPELEESRRLRKARERLEEVKSRLNQPQKVLRLFGESEASFLSNQPQGTSEITLQSNFTVEEYLCAVAAVREYIAAGDIFQVNLSQRFEVELPVSPYELYMRLRQVNPAPFASYLNFDGMSIAGASPERFLCLRGDVVETRPIKGTRPRGKDVATDAALAYELLHSAKDRAENVMIVDLERNDLGRVCCYGTVKVTELAILETFPTVFHLTSTIMGRVREDKSRIDLLKATFPGGSITGAPKVRAMEIITELEPTKRSVYTGSIGYLSFSGELDLNIVIRTFLVKGSRVYFQVGGGIVYDSDPEAEYLETLDKAQALIQALKLTPKVVVATR